MATEKISEILKALVLKASVDASGPDDSMDTVIGEWDALIEYCAALNKDQRQALTYLLSKQIVSIVARAKVDEGYKITSHVHHELDHRNKVGELVPSQWVEIAKFLRNKPIEVLDCATRYWIFYHYNQLPETKHQTEYFNYMKDTVERIRSTGV